MAGNELAYKFGKKHVKKTALIQRSAPLAVFHDMPNDLTLTLYLCLSKEQLL